MTESDREQFMDYLLEDSIPAIEWVRVPSQRADLHEEWEALMEAAKELRDALGGTNVPLV